MSAEAPPPPPQAPPPVVRRRSDRGRIYTVLAVVVVAVVIVGVGAGTSWYGLKSSSTTGCPSATTIQGAGAAFPAAIVSQWTSEFQGATSNLVNYAPSGAGAGISDLTSKAVDFAVTDEPLNATEDADMIAAVGTVLTLPVTGGAVVLVYHISGYSGPLNLTATDIADMYLGTITTWNATALVANNPGLTSVKETVAPVHRVDPAGMTYVLTNLLSDEDHAWATNASLGTSIDPSWPTVAAAVGATGNSQMLSDVKAGTGAIGYTDLYDAQLKGLSIASIENSHGSFIAPTVADTESAINDTYAAIGATLPPATGDWASVSWVNASGATDYPLATLVYLMAPQNPGQGHTHTLSEATVLREWIDWVATQGQFYSRTSFPFASPPAPLLTQDVNALSGMNFNGTSIPSCT